MFTKANTLKRVNPVHTAKHGQDVNMEPSHIGSTVVSRAVKAEKAIHALYHVVVFLSQNSLHSLGMQN